MFPEVNERDVYFHMLIVQLQVNYYRYLTFIKQQTKNKNKNLVYSNKSIENQFGFSPNYKNPKLTVSLFREKESSLVEETKKFVFN